MDFLETITLTRESYDELIKKIMQLEAGEVEHEKELKMSSSQVFDLLEKLSNLKVLALKGCRANEYNYKNFELDELTDLTSWKCGVNHEHINELLEFCTEGQIKEFIVLQYYLINKEDKNE